MRAYTVSEVSASACDRAASPRRMASMRAAKPRFPAGPFWRAQYTARSNDTVAEMTLSTRSGHMTSPPLCMMDQK